MCSKWFLKRTISVDSEVVGCADTVVTVRGVSGRICVNAEMSVVCCMFFLVVVSDSASVLVIISGAVVTSVCDTDGEA